MSEYVDEVTRYIKHLRREVGVLYDILSSAPRTLEPEEGFANFSEYVSILEDTLQGFEQCVHMSRVIMQNMAQALTACVYAPPDVMMNKGRRSCD